MDKRGKVGTSYRPWAVERESRKILGRIWIMLLPACLILSLAIATPGASQAFEVPANRSAAKILPPNLLAGPNHRVRDKVVSYGYMHHFTVDSDFGVFEVTGNGALRKSDTALTLPRDSLRVSVLNSNLQRFPSFVPPVIS